MTLLTPWMLLVGLAVAVPLILHLLHRREVRRIVFPALRYLVRTERDRARRIRLRQLLLLLLRVGAILLVALAAARPMLPGSGEDHPPTAIAIVLDNSLSTGRIVGEERVLDRLREAGIHTVETAGPEDRIWVLPASEPWEIALPLTPAEALDRLRGSEPTDAGTSLVAALESAGALVRSARLEAAEIHILTDLQAAGFGPGLQSGGREGGNDVPGDVSGDENTTVSDPPIREEGESTSGDEGPPVLVYAPDLGPGARNRGITEVLVGGGLAPVAGRETPLSVRISSSGNPEPGPDEAAERARISIGGRLRAALDVPLPGEAATLIGPFASGVVEGSVEIDPDDLRADDQRHFAFMVAPPPRVGLVGGTPPLFLSAALGVLADAGRIRISEAGGADLVLSLGGGGFGDAEGSGSGTDAPPSALVVPPSDPARLPALNQALARLGVPWRYQAPAAAADTLQAGVTIPALAGVAIRRRYPLDALTGTGEARGAGEVVARTGSGAVWAVAVHSGERDLLLIGSDLSETASDLPISAGFLPFLEWAARGLGAGGEGVGTFAGNPLSLPPAATHVEDPTGTRVPVDGARSFTRTGRAGIYRVFSGDSLLLALAVNPPPEESRLDRADPDRAETVLRGAAGGSVRIVEDIGDWSRAIFHERRGPELWRPLLFLLLLLLIVESALAASGRARRGGRGAESPASRRERFRTSRAHT